MRRAGEARMSLSWALTQQGDIASALVEAERALPALEGASRARMLAQRATILQRLGRFAESLEGYRSAVDRVAAGRRRAVGSAAPVQPRRAAGPPGCAGCRRGRPAARRGAARLDRPDPRRDPGPPQPRLGRRAAWRRPGRAGLVRPRGGRVPRAGRAARAAADGPLRRAALRTAGDRGERERAGRRHRAGGRQHGLRPRGSTPAGRPGRAARGDAAAARSHALQADATFARQGRTAWTALASAAAARAAWMEVETAAAGAARRRTRGRAASKPGVVHADGRAERWRPRWLRRGGRSGRSTRPAGASRRSTRG